MFNVYINMLMCASNQTAIRSAHTTEGMIFNIVPQLFISGASKNDVLETVTQD